MATSTCTAFLSLSHVLSFQAECVYAGPGNISCICNEGWTGDGTVCAEINNCQLKSRGGCDKYAECVPTGPGQVPPAVYQLHQLWALLIYFASVTGKFQAKVILTKVGKTKPRKLMLIYSLRPSFYCMLHVPGDFYRHMHFLGHTVCEYRCFFHASMLLQWFTSPLYKLWLIPFSKIYMQCCLWEKGMESKVIKYWPR